MLWEQVKATVRNGQIHWRDLFDERQLKAIRFDRLYADPDQFSHGTDGHNMRLLIARMAALLDAIEGEITFIGEDK